MLFRPWSFFRFHGSGEYDLREDVFSIVADRSESLKSSGLGVGSWLRIREAKFSLEVLRVTASLVGWEEEGIEVGWVLAEAGLAGEVVFGSPLAERVVAAGMGVALSGL